MDVSDRTTTVSTTVNSPRDTEQLNLSHFICPLCSNYMLSPYYQCTRGHLVCQTCRSRATVCVCCHGTYPTVRNLIMERIADTLYFPCSFARFGCNQSFHPNLKTDHEIDCIHRPVTQYPCPLDECRWSGALSSISNHIVINHAFANVVSERTHTISINGINQTRATRRVMMLHCYKNDFIIIIETGPCSSFVYAYVRMIATKVDADKFAYVITVPLNHLKSLSLEGVPLSVENNVDVYSTGEFLMLNMGTPGALDADGYLTLGIKITQL